jgi:predicted metal-dependent peptidase
MEEARAGLISRHPSLGYLCFKLRWFPDSTAPRAWTDGISVGFNPDFVLSLTKAERRFLAAHEVAHPMLGHHLRRESREPKQWNRACDYVVNLILIDQGFTLISGALLDYQYKGMAVEQVFALIEPTAPEDQDQSKDSTQSGQTDDSSPSDDQDGSEGQEDQEDGSEDNGGGSDDTGDIPSDQSDADGSGSGSEDQGPDDSEDSQPGESSGDAGEESGDSGSTGAGPSEVDQPDGSEVGEPGGSPNQDSDVGEVRDYPGETSEDFDMESERWDLAVQQAAATERRLSEEGDVPGFVETMLTNISDPKLPWTSILARWLVSKAKNDYTWSKPNTRYSSSGIFMPAVESFDLGLVALFWDTSCSVTDDQVGDIGAETQGILAHFPGVLIDLYHIDTKVQYIEEIDQYTDWDEITARGRGGTDFRPGFEAIEDGSEEDPIGVIYMTDGECSKFPEEAPPYPVLWIVLDMPQNLRFDPPFGEVAYYNDF